MKIEINGSVNKRHKILCINCKRKTNHIVLASIDTIDREDWAGDFFAWEARYQIVQCQGCDEISFRSETSNSEDYNPYTGKADIDELVFPRRTEETINVKNYMNIPYNLNLLYKEVIDCYNNNILVLCGAGVRALVEGLCIEKNIVDGEISFTNQDGSVTCKRVKNLQGRINGLYEKGILTKENAEVLHNHRFLGNEAIHELTPSSKKELSLAIGIIEVIFDSIYEIPAKAKELNRARMKKKNLT